MKGEMDLALAAVGEIPPMPGVANKVMAAVSDPATSADDLRQIIERDPSLAARLLRIANSSLYGFRREVETLRHAITLLGFRTIESTVMAASLREVFANFGLGEKLLWEHATLCGVVSAKLASYGPIDVEREPAFTAGLLHDLGKISMSNVFRDRYAKVMSRIYTEGVSYLEAELDEFGFDHARLGAHIAEHWDLPNALVTAIRRHHDLPESYEDLDPPLFRLVALTSISTTVCTRLGFGRRGPVEAIDLAAHPAWTALGLSEEDVEPVLEVTIEEAKRAEGLFG